MSIKKLEARFEISLEKNKLTKLYEFLVEIGLNNDQDFVVKNIEENRLLTYIEENDLWYEDLPFSIYLSEGAEQKVFYFAHKKKVLKLNDGIFYVNWNQYFEAILVHNILFKETAYSFLGFVLINKKLYAVISQDYIEPTEKTSIEGIQGIMFSKGFNLKRRNDYVHNELGLIIEDLHEENVLVRNGVFYFIDTVIYLK